MTVLGMIGSVVTGIFGMNLFGFAEIPVALQPLVLVAVTASVAAVLFYMLSKSKGLADFLDGVSDERLSISGKMRVLMNVWAKKRG